MGSLFPEPKKNKAEERNASLPKISCSSMGSTSSSSLTTSDAAPGSAKGSLRYADSGTVLAKRPSVCLLELWEEPRRRRRVGRSEALRMVGLALRISDMVCGLFLRSQAVFSTCGYAIRNS